MFFRLSLLAILLFTSLWSDTNETNQTKESSFSLSKVFDFWGDTEDKNETNDTNETNNTSLKPQTDDANETTETNSSSFSLSNVSKKLTGYVDKISHIISSKFNGNWHLHQLDGMEVRAARAILEFDLDTMEISGFDACSRINGKLKEKADENLSVSKLTITTHMACRQSIHQWTSIRLHETLKEGFSIKEDQKNGTRGITIKSKSHTLFLKRMGDMGEDVKPAWVPEFLVK